MWTGHVMVAPPSFDEGTSLYGSMEELSIQGFITQRVYGRIIGR